MRVILGLICGALLAAPATALAEDRVVLRRAPGLDATERAALRAEVDGRLIERVGNAGTETEVIAVPAGAARAAATTLASDADVRWAEPDVAVHGAAADPIAQWGLGVIGAPAAWATTTGTGATVAVVDSGATFGHEDLAGQWATNPGEIAGNHKDDDHNGKVDDWRGWDWVGNDDNDPTDTHGHGTHVTGIIAAAGDNGMGISGVAPGARIMPLRVLDENKSGYLSDVASAFRYAGSLGIRVVNASLTGPAGLQAVNDAIHAYPNTLFVVAAGNRGADVETSADYPCVIPEPNLVCVAATDADDHLAAYSNYGAIDVDLAAPGNAVTSTCLPNTYCVMSGTSMAAPHVAGATALLAARAPSATAAQLEDALLSTAMPLPGLSGTTVSGGRLDAAAALGVVAPAPAPPVGSTTPDPAPTPPPPEPTPSTDPPLATDPVSTPTPTPTKQTGPRRLKVTGRSVDRRGTVAASFVVSEPATVRVTLTPVRCRAAACRQTRTLRAGAGRTTIRLRAPRGRAYTLSAIALV